MESPEVTSSENISGIINGANSMCIISANKNYNSSASEVLVNDVSSSRKHNMEEEVGLPISNDCTNHCTGVPPTKKQKFEEKMKLKTPVSILNELCHGLSYNIVEGKDSSNNLIFTASVEINGTEYKGQGKNKKLAKHNVAQKVLDEHIDLSVLAAHYGKSLKSVLSENSVDIAKENNCSDQDQSILNERRSFRSKRKKKKGKENLKEIFANSSVVNCECKEKNAPKYSEKNPVMLLNELVPKVKYVLALESGDAHAKSFKFITRIGDNEYYGTGSNKKTARAAAARKALSETFRLIPKGGGNMEKLEESSELHLKQKLADVIATKVTEKFSELNKKYVKNVALAGFVLTQGDENEFVKVISVSSGTLCVQNEGRSVKGQTVNDCHAEIISRRGLMNYLYSHLNHLVNGTTLDDNECILEKRPEGNGYRLKEKFQINLYINTAPCGEACIFVAGEADSTENRKKRTGKGHLRIKVQSGVGTIRIEQVDNVRLQSWDGTLKVQRLLSMSCSDKIAKWNAVGLQGGLLSNYIEPIYLNSLVLGSLFHASHIYRTLVGRIEDHYKGNDPYVLHKPKMSPESSTQSRQPQQVPNLTLNWDCCTPEIELLDASTGIVKGGSISRLCKFELFKRFSSLLKSPSVSPLTDIKKDDLESLTYGNFKDSSVAYKNAKLALHDAFRSAELGNWVQKTIDCDSFQLPVDV